MVVIKGRSFYSLSQTPHKNRLSANISPQQTIYPVVHPLIPRLSRLEIFRDQILTLNRTLNSQGVMRRLLLNKKPKITEMILLHFTIS